MPANVPNPSPALGERLAAHAGHLRLLFEHLAGRAVRTRVELDDLVQEVFLRVLAAPGSVPPHETGDAGLRRYLAHVARHVTVDVARALRAGKRDGRELRLDRADWSRAGLAESRVVLRQAGPATRAGHGEDQERLSRAYASLAPEHRRVIGLRQFLGLDARETARRMGRSESAVHSLYRRALLAWEHAARPA